MRLQGLAVGEQCEPTASPCSRIRGKLIRMLVFAKPSAKLYRWKMAAAGNCIRHFVRPWEFHSSPHKGRLWQC